MIDIVNNGNSSSNVNCSSKDNSQASVVQVVHTATQSAENPKCLKRLREVIIASNTLYPTPYKGWCALCNLFSRKISNRTIHAKSTSSIGSDVLNNTCIACCIAAGILCACIVVFINTKSFNRGNIRTQS